MRPPKSTPGPWRAAKGMISKWMDQVVGPNQESIASVEIYQSGYPDRETANANAYLLAAAPELYEALQAIAILDDGDEHFAWKHENEFDRARAALAKARGESQ